MNIIWVCAVDWIEFIIMIIIMQIFVYAYYWLFSSTHGLEFLIPVLFCVSPRLWFGFFRIYYVMSVQDILMVITVGESSVYSVVSMR